MTEKEPALLAMTMGDPAGVGPSMTADAWKFFREDPAYAFFVIGAPGLYASSVPLQTISSPAEAANIFSGALPVLPLESVPVAIPGEPDTAAAHGIIASIEQAVGFCLDGQATGMVTNPINKDLLYGAGFKHPGHTEFIAKLCEPAAGMPLKPVMLLTGGGLRVALATIHVPLNQVSTLLTVDKLIELGHIVSAALKTDLGIHAPRIAFTGLNPHAGENGAIGKEEIEIINPAARALRESGIDMSDARSADTVFAEALEGRYDAVIAMTHDQGLIPVKTLDMWGGVNTTLGLPIVRTSPDHGTGYDAARAGTARPDSLIAAVRQARSIANHRKAMA